jgi:hypothetical protein
MGSSFFTTQKSNWIKGTADLQRYHTYVLTLTLAAKAPSTVTYDLIDGRPSDQIWVYVDGEKVKSVYVSSTLTMCSYKYMI